MLGSESRTECIQSLRSEAQGHTAIGTIIKAMDKNISDLWWSNTDDLYSYLNVSEYYKTFTLDVIYFDNQE